MKKFCEYLPKFFLQNCTLKYSFTWYTINELKMFTVDYLILSNHRPREIEIYDLTVLLQFIPTKWMWTYFFFGFFSFSFSSNSFIRCGVGGDFGAAHRDVGELSREWASPATKRRGLACPFCPELWCRSLGGVWGGVTARPPFSWPLGTGERDWWRLWAPFCCCCWWWCELTPLHEPRGTRKLGGVEGVCGWGSSLAEDSSSLVEGSLFRWMAAEAAAALIWAVILLVITEN